jgi:hypothetical protein
MEGLRGHLDASKSLPMQPASGDEPQPSIKRQSGSFRHTASSLMIHGIWLNSSPPFF